MISANLSSLHFSYQVTATTQVLWRKAKNKNTVKKKLLQSVNVCLSQFSSDYHKFRFLDDALMNQGLSPDEATMGQYVFLNYFIL